MYLLEQGTAERLKPQPGRPPRLLTMWSPPGRLATAAAGAPGPPRAEGRGPCAPAAGDAIGRRRGAARRARPWLAAAGPQWRRGPPRAPPLRRGGVPCAARSPPEGAQPSPWLPRRRLGPAPRWPRARRAATSTGCAPSSPEVGAPGGPCPVSAGPAWGERGAGARGGCGGQAESIPMSIPGEAALRGCRHPGKWRLSSFSSPLFPRCANAGDSGHTGEPHVWQNRPTAPSSRRLHVHRARSLVGVLGYPCLRTAAKIKVVRRGGSRVNTAPRYEPLWEQSCLFFPEGVVPAARCASG